MPSRVDLHTHTTASDGTMDPQTLVSKAAELGVEVLAISDHDTTAGLEAVVSAFSGRTLPLRLIPGIEVNAEGPFACHLLGYFIDVSNANLQTTLATLRSARVERLRATAAQLSKLGYPIDFEAVVGKADHSLGRPHIADALIAAKFVRSRQEAFDRFLKKDGVAYIGAETPTIEQSISLIRGAGGIPVLAHPSYYTDEALLKSLVDRGLRGIEAYYPEHSRSLTETYVRWAQSMNLLTTGGSDFHGPKTGRSALACVDVPRTVVDALDRAQAR